MIMLKADDECMVCGQCFLACPNKAIHFELGAYQNYFPVIDKALCSECRKCEEHCQSESRKAILNHDSWRKSAYYTGYYKNAEIREKSSSGGLFSAFALWVLKNDGVVIGASFNPDTQSVKHIAISDVSDLGKLRKSKYVQSDWVDSCKAIMQAIRSEKAVLFSGTPCQAATARQFFGDYKKLYIIDLFCHGVSGAGFLGKYLQTFDEKVSGIDFRYKEPGAQNNYIMHMQFNGRSQKEKWSDNFLCKLFVNSASLKKACFQCPYADCQHAADITIGDFDFKDYARQKEINYTYPSVIAVNTRHGAELFQQIKSDLIYAKLENEDLIRHYYRRHEGRQGPWGYNEIEWKSFQEQQKKLGFINAALLSVYPNEMRLITEAEKIKAPKDEIIIYGAGVYGNRLLRIIRIARKDWVIRCFAVTNREKADMKIQNIPVLSIGEINLNNSVIIAGISEKYEKEILNELKCRNIDRFII